MASPTRPRDLRILRIGVVDRILGDNIGGYREVACSIGERVGRIDMLVYSPRRHNFRPTALRSNSTVYPTRSLSKLHFFRDAFRLGDQLQRKLGYTLIVAADPMGSGLVGCWLKGRYGVPLLIRCHSDYYSSAAWRLESPRHWFDHLLSIRLLRQADLVQVVSQRISRDVIRLGVPPERVAVLPSIVRSDLLTPGDDGLERYASRRLLFVGRLVKSKNLPTLLRAVHRLVESGYEPRLVLIGTGPLRQQLQALAHRLNIEACVEFAGHKSQEALVAFYQESSLLVLPSGYEAFGKVIVEAGLCGLPIVATHVGGIPELVVEGETGLLVPPRDPTALARAIARLLDDAAFARRIGQEAQLRFQKTWNQDAMVSAQIALLEQAALGR